MFGISQSNLLMFVGLICIVGLIIWLTTKEKMEADGSDETMDEDTAIYSDVFAPTPAPVDIPQRPRTLPDVADQEDALSNYYDGDLKGQDGVDDNEIVGIDESKQRGDNYNDGYTLGVDLNDPAYKELGVVQTTNKLVSSDLLPKEKKDWFDTPQVGTSVQDANLLADATYRMGMDTIGNSRRGMVTDPRGAIPTPKINVGPWNQSSRDPPMSSSWCN